MPKRLAEDWPRETLHQARAGTLPGMVRTGATFADVAAEYLRYVEQDCGRKPVTLLAWRRRGSAWDHARVLAKVNVVQCETQRLWERGKFQTTYNDLTDALGGQVIGATVFETGAGHTRGPYHFHDGVEEWMYVVCGEPVLRDPSGERALEPGALVAFQSGPEGAHTFDGPGRVVMFSVGARGWGEAFTSVYLDADKIGGKPGVQFLRSAALQAWPEPAVAPVPPAPPGACPQVDMKSFRAGGPSLVERLHTQTWAPSLYELAGGETTGAYHYDWCREHWAVVLDGAPTLRHPDGQDVMTPGEIVCFPEGEAGAHQFLNHAAQPARLLVCSAPVTGPSATVYPDDNMYVLRVPGQNGYRFQLTDQLEDYWDGEPGANLA